MQLKMILALSVATVVVVTADKGNEEEDDNNVGYKYSYGVHDPHTHDFKEHHEERNGKYVTGFYTFKEADDTTRVVRYKVGPNTGFEAVVERVEQAGHNQNGDNEEEGGDKGDDGNDGQQGDGKQKKEDGPGNVYEYDH